MLRPRHVLSTTAATILTGALSLGLTVLVARLLAPEQNGNYAQFVLLLNLANIALNLGLGPASTYFVASGRASRSRVIRINVLALSGIAVIGAVLLVVLRLVGALDGFSAAFKIPVPLLSVGAAAGLLMLAGNAAMAVLMGGHRYDTVNALNVARNALVLVMVVGAALAGARTPLAISVAHLVGLALAAVAAFACLRRRGRDAPAVGAAAVGGTPDAGGARVGVAMLSYGWILYLSNLLHYFAMRGLILLVSRYETAASVGFLTTALLLLEVTLLVPSAMGQLLFPQSSGAGFDNARLAVLLRVNTYLGVVMIAAVALVGRPVIVAVLGPAYAPVATALLHLTPSIVLLAIPRILSQILSGQGRARYPLVAAAVSFALGGLAALVLLPRYGFIGAAWVTNLVSFVTAIVTLYGYCSSHELTLARVLRPRRDDLAPVWRMVTARRAAR
jgi:O-antigen/teichoic acid export membrane protein